MTQDTLAGKMIRVHAGAIGEKQDHIGMCRYSRKLLSGRYLLNIDGRGYILSLGNFIITCCDAACDGEGPHVGEIRVLPAWEHSNLLLCRHCFTAEIQWRAERNATLEPKNHYALPAWETLDIYQG